MKTDLAEWVVSDPDILGGTPCFKGTRVPVRILFEHIAGGSAIDQFLKDFDWLNRDAVLRVFEFSNDSIDEIFTRASA